MCSSDIESAQEKVDKQHTLECGIVIADQTGENPFPMTCWLVPQDLVVGVGCRRGKQQEVLQAFIEETFKTLHLREERIVQLVSIDVKKDEGGLIEEARRRRILFRTYSKEQLEAVEGDFTP